jgi:hypothetical protein
VQGRSKEILKSQAFLDHDIRTGNKFKMITLHILFCIDAIFVKKKRTISIANPWDIRHKLE